MRGNELADDVFNRPRKSYLDENINAFFIKISQIHFLFLRQNFKYHFILRSIFLINFNYVIDAIICFILFYCNFLYNYIL